LNPFKLHSQKRDAKLLHQAVTRRINELDIHNTKITEEDRQRIYDEFHKWLSDLKGYGFWNWHTGSLSSRQEAIETIDSMIEMAKVNYESNEYNLRDESEHGLGYEILDMDEGYAKTLNEEKLKDAQRDLDCRQGIQQEEIRNAKEARMVALQMFVEATTLKNLYEQDSSDLLIDDMYRLLSGTYVGDEFISESSTIMGVWDIESSWEEFRDCICPIKFYFPKNILEKPVSTFDFMTLQAGFKQKPTFRSAIFGPIPYELKNLYKGIKLMAASVEIAEVSGYAREIEVLNKELDWMDN